MWWVARGCLASLEDGKRSIPVIHASRWPLQPIAQWLVLRKGKGNALGDKRITPRLVKQFMAAYNGMYAQGMRLSIHSVLTPNLCVRR